jgi:RNA 2',3'-cyclic 3'-phosphodiesterase
MSVVRAFIAIELPALAQETIDKQTARLQQTLGRDLVRWTPTHNIHITLKFLGDVAAAHIGFLKQMLTRELANHAGFDLQIGGLGSFPNSKRPRVLWLGLQEPRLHFSPSNGPSKPPPCAWGMKRKSALFPRI